MACLDIKADNIMFGTEDNTIFEEFEKEELRNPTPRKEIDGRVIYVSRQLQFPQRLAPPVVCDFGSAVLGDKEHDEDVQPDVYRSPEVILKVPWSYQIDIWNVGCMVRFIVSRSRPSMSLAEIKCMTWLRCISRSGISLKTDTCSTAPTPNTALIVAVRTWPRLSHFWVLPHRSLSLVES